MRAQFPFEHIRDTQKKFLRAVADAEQGVLIEGPTGMGKTVCAITALRSAQKIGKTGLFYVTINRNLVRQVASEFPEDVFPMVGRGDHPCLYYEGNISAHESPCYMLDCPHRIQKDTGLPIDEDIEPCPYLHDKWMAMQYAESGKKIIVTTAAWYLMNRLYVSDWYQMDPNLTVVDECHRLPSIARHLFEYQVTDYHLFRCADMIKDYDEESAKLIEKFAKRMIHLIEKNRATSPTLVPMDHVKTLIGLLDEIDTKRVEKHIRKAIRSGVIDPFADRAMIKTLENFLRHIPRLIKTLKYAMEARGRQPLNYVVAFYYKEDDPDFAETKKRAQYILTIKSYYVIPVISTTFGKNILAMSATIGRPDVFANESGFKFPFISLASEFPIEQTRVYMPTDTPDLARKKRFEDTFNRQALNPGLRTIISAVKEFASHGHRSLVVVVSEKERKKFLAFAKDQGLEDVVTYDKDIKPKQAAEAFKQGHGTVLLGTAANFAEGVDLPAGIAPVIFFLRPGYQNPRDPEAQFEESRFSNGKVWALRNWRVMIEALQVRGRNIRSAEDLGVTFFISQGFRNFLRAALPEWLKPAYKGDMTMQQGIKDALKLLNDDKAA